MKLYNSLGPNPRLVRMFMLEKGIELPCEEIDLMAAENRRPPYTQKNPAGQLPALELDDGRVIAETVAICELLEERKPAPALIGATPEERAEARMWERRIELRITIPLADGFRFAEGLALFKDRLHVEPDAAPGLKRMAQDGLRWLDGQLGSRDTIVPGRFTLADIVLYAFLDFAPGVGQPLPADVKNVARWFESVAKRDSAAASLHPVAKAAGMAG